MLIPLLIGSLLVLNGLIMLARPQIVDWLNDQTNLRRLKEYSQTSKYEENLRKYRKNMWVLRVVLPPALLLIGAVLILQGAGVLD